MEVSTLIRQRLKDLGLEQKDLAGAADVTESYISQLLRRKKMPPAGDRTHIYEKLGKFLKLPPGELAKLADYQRKRELKKKIEDPPMPLLREVRELLLRKCKAAKRDEVAAIFGKEPFGELERLVTQKFVDVIRSLAKEAPARDNWLRFAARANGKTYKQMRMAALKCLNGEVLSTAAKGCLPLMDPSIVSWDIDLRSFAIEIVLERRVNGASIKRFEFVESDTNEPVEEPGLRAFLKDSSVSGDATESEIEFLKQLRFKNSRRPTALYYYRELQSLRDPLHFREK